MATIQDAYQAGIDAVVADNTLNRGGFVDALQTVITSNLSNQEGNDYVDAVAGEFQRLGIINNATFNNLRSNIIADPVLHLNLWIALGTTLNALPATVPVAEAAALTQLREDRDNANAAIDRLQAISDAEPGPAPVRRLVREILRDGKGRIREYKEQVRDQIKGIIGDPDG